MFSVLVCAPRLGAVALQSRHRRRPRVAFPASFLLAHTLCIPARRAAFRAPCSWPSASPGRPVRLALPECVHNWGKGHDCVHGLRGWPIVAALAAKLLLAMCPDLRVIGCKVPGVQALHFLSKAPARTSRAALLRAPFARFASPNTRNIPPLVILSAGSECIARQGICAAACRMGEIELPQPSHCNRLKVNESVRERTSFL